MAAASIYHSLFNEKLIGAREEENALIIDEWCKGDSGKNIVATFEHIFMIGWKYHAS